MEPTMEPDWSMIDSVEDLVVFKDTTSMIISKKADRMLAALCRVIVIMTRFNGGDKRLSYPTCDSILSYCLYICDPNPYKNRALELVRAFMDAMEEMIITKILPCLQAQTDEEQLLSILILIWEEYKEIVRWLSFVLDPLSDAYLSSTGSTLRDLSFDIFIDLVCKRMFIRFVDAAISMIRRERDEQPINGDLLQKTIRLLIEIQYRVDKYYRYFELVLQLDVQCHYSLLFWEWIENETSFTSYLEKAEECLNLEDMRMTGRVLPGTKERIMEAIREELVDNQAREIVKLMFGF